MYRYILSIILILSSSVVVATAQNADLDKIIDFQTQKFKYILETAAKNHPDSLDFLKISDKAFEALLQAMDKESYYYDKSTYKLVSQSTSGVKYGTGIELVSLRDTVYVIQIFASSPGAKSDVSVGDKIISIDGKSVQGFSKQEAEELLSGDSATTVNLVLKDCISQKEKKVKLIRQEVLLPSVTSAYMFPRSTIGVFTINRFSETTPSELRELANKFLLKGMNRMIIDLRDNPGGYVNKVDEILDMLIGGNLILTQLISANTDYISKYYSKNGDFLENIPVVAIINNKSASGSEIISGVLQDYDRGIVIGTQSYGKGSMQKIWSMNDSTGFKLTVGKYLTPSGREIQTNPTNNNFLKANGLDTAKSIDEFVKVIENSKDKNKPQILRTSSGRPIISIGGIVPDYIVNEDTLTQLTNLLIRGGIYFEWSTIFKQKYGQEILDKFGDDYSKFNLEYQITDEILQDFAGFAVKHNIWNTDMFNKDKSYFINYIKASIANVLWDYNAFSEVLSISDNLILAALIHLPEADKLIKK